MNQWAEARAREEEYRREEALRNPPWSILAGTSLMKPLQRKAFRVQDGLEVWVAYEFEGKPVDLRVMICAKPHWAMMAANALNEVQARLAKEEDDERRQRMPVEKGDGPVGNADGHL